MDIATFDCPQQIQQLFADHDLRYTRQRCAVYQALAGTKAHPTADELFRTVSHSDQSISLATVYNALEAFCRVGIAQKLATDDLSARYDAAVHNHLHLRDARTGRVSDVPDHLGQQLLDKLPREVILAIESRLGYKVSEIKIELLGEPA
jgi:Fur family peroxide stress response transcriptional regulator